MKFTRGRLTKLIVTLIKPSKEKFIFLYKRKRIRCTVLFIDNDICLGPELFVCLKILVLNPFGAISACLDLFSNFSEDIAESIETLELSFDLNNSPKCFCFPSNIIPIYEFSLLGGKHL